MSHILCEIDDTPGARTARVMLHHAGKFNAMSRSMWRSLKQVFLELQQQTTAANPLRCVVLQGADGHFCSGGDIAEYPDFRFIPELEWKYGYVYVILLMVASAVGPMVYFRRRGWLK